MNVTDVTFAAYLFGAAVVWKVASFALRIHGQGWCQLAPNLQKHIRENVPEDKIAACETYLRWSGFFEQKLLLLYSDRQPLTPLDVHEAIESLPDILSQFAFEQANKRQFFDAFNILVVAMHLREDDWRLHYNASVYCYFGGNKEGAHYFAKEAERLIERSEPEWTEDTVFQAAVLFCIATGGDPRPYLLGQNKKRDDAELSASSPMPPCDKCHSRNVCIVAERTFYVRSPEVLKSPDDQVPKSTTKTYWCLACTNHYSRIVRSG